MNLKTSALRVISSYIANLPEVTNNAYSYFNYDHRIVDERVSRGDDKIPYYTAKDISDIAYESLVFSAFTRLNPTLLKYGKRVAYEDALHMAIRDFGNGFFDGKVNANAFNVLVEAMMNRAQVIIMAKDKKPTEKILTPEILKKLKMKIHEVPTKGSPHPLVLERERSQIRLRKHKP